MEPSTGRPAWLVVGLGNPGPAYLWTPHNLGFMVVDAVAARAGIAFHRHSAGALVGQGRFAGVELVLAKPQTYMNASGGPVRSLLEEYELQPERLIVISDDVALPWGSVRIRERGSGGGHRPLPPPAGWHRPGRAARGPHGLCAAAAGARRAAAGCRSH